MTDTPVDEPPEKTDKKTGRAGRNLPAAIGVGVVLGGLAIGILLFAPIWWLPVLAIAIPIGMHEVIRRLRGLRVADATAFSLCMDNGMPILVFNLLTDGNIARAVAGEKIGTLVTS